MPARDLIVIGASAGGVDALVRLMGGLPRDLPATVVVAMHLAPGTTSVLPDILARVGQLPASHPKDGEAYQKGKVYVAPSDHHLLIRNGHFRLTRGARENLHRPAIDPLFRSAAVAHGPRVIGVVLTGALDDGTAGLSAVKRCGGTAVVQDPKDASHPSMPASALKNVAVDHIVPVSEMAALLAALAGEAVQGARPPAPASLAAEVGMTERQEDAKEVLDQIGARSAVTCPECHGTLWELSDDPAQYRCHVGHAYSPRTLVSEHSRRLEDALWAAIRGFEESATLSDRLVARNPAGDRDGIERLMLRGETARQRANELRKLIDTLPVED